MQHQYESRLPLSRIAAIALLASLSFFSFATLAGAQVTLRVEAVHAWRPPFGIERVGQGKLVVVEAPGDGATPPMTLSAMLGGKEVARQAVQLPEKAPRLVRVTLPGVFHADELVLTAAAAAAGAAAADIARIKCDLPAFEADALAAPEQVINPVDLGAILVPSDWLLLGPGQKGKLSVRALHRGDAKNGITIKAWFESAPDKPVTAPLSLASGTPGDAQFELPVGSAEKDVLHVAALAGDGQTLWTKDITTMRVSKAPELPKFGAVEMKLRYDAPISVKDVKTGAFSPLPYEAAFDPKFNDVVVALPNGSRYVFWRGSSYIPFWASQNNLGLSYEWAECTSGFPGSVDCVEPLMDKELRYAKVEIVESTAARVHVRWTYQSTDLIYQVWGDQAVEDYYFYPDGFGTRVLNLKRDPAAVYEISELIILTPQETYPFSVVQHDGTSILYADGQKHTIVLPTTDASPPGSLGTQRDVAGLFRVQLHKNDKAAAIYFNPRDRKLPEGIFGAFRDAGQLVTPAYWGSHWPLARGKSTGYAIDDRVHFTPCHTSVLTWGHMKSEPTMMRTGGTLDSKGRLRTMINEQFVWLIGMTDASEARLLEWVSSFSQTSSIEATGATVGFGAYSDARRTVQLTIDSPKVSLKLTPAVGKCVNPVFELQGAPGPIKSVTIDGQTVDAGRYAFDGHVLWTDVTFDKQVQIGLEFAAP